MGAAAHLLLWPKWLRRSCSRRQTQRAASSGSESCRRSGQQLPRFLNDRSHRVPHRAHADRTRRPQASGRALGTRARIRHVRRNVRQPPMRPGSAAALCRPWHCCTADLRRKVRWHTGMIVGRRLFSQTNDLASVLKKYRAARAISTVGASALVCHASLPLLLEVTLDLAPPP